MLIEFAATRPVCTGENMPPPRPGSLVSASVAARGLLGDRITGAGLDAVGRVGTLGWPGDCKS